MLFKRKRQHLLNTLIIILFLSNNLFASDPFVRYPALSGDGENLLFTYQGDIWRVASGGGAAKRLTTNPANDSHPEWNTNADQVAFISDRNGNYDIYVLPLDGRPVKQLTHHSKNDVISSWNNDEILFTSSRYFAQVEREDDMLAIHDAGGTPYRITDAVGFEPSVSPDGNRVAFVRGSCRTSREAYRGSANRDIWILNKKTGKYFQVTTFDGNDFMPRWKNNNTLAFISARDGKYNVFQVDVSEEGKPVNEVTAITDFKKDGIRYFTLSEDGKKMAFEKGSRIFMWENEQSKAVDIAITKDFLFPDKEFKTFSKDVSGFKLSPSEKQIAFVIRGNLYVKYNDKRATNAKTVEGSAARVKSFDWLDEKTIVYSSDKHNQYDIFTVTSQSDDATLYEALTYSHERLTKTKKDESQLTVSPEKDRLAYVRGNGTLITAAVTPKKLNDENVLLDGWSQPGDLAWSPDSKWLAYALKDMKGNREIYIHSADGKKDPVNVSMHPRNDRNPVWGHDKLAFISDRNNGDSDLWFVWLTKADWQRTKDEWTEEAFLKSDTTEEKDETINIDFKDIYKRITQVTGLPGNESDIQMSPDGKTFYFVTNRDDRSNYKAPNDIYSIQWDGKELKPVTTGNKQPYRMTLDKEGKELYYVLKGGKLAKTTLKGKKEQAISFKATAWVDHREQNEQKFEEAWRAIENGFYDPDFHGRDWSELKEKYKPWCMAASTKNDFTYAFNLMLGQINASHMGLRNTPERYPTSNTRTGLLGIDIDPEKTGVRVREVLENTPAARKESALFAGDLITHVDGNPVSQSANFYLPLNHTAKHKVILTVERDGDDQQVVIIPTSSIRNQRYDDWVEERRAITNKISGGRLGYIHIRGMNWSSFEAFERELAANAYEKEGLVVDVRFNGGGWTTDYLMAILDVRQHAYTIPRGATNNLKKNNEKFRNTYPFGERLPFFPWTKPSVALCNQNSYSNAEIFSHAFKTLDIGTLVGTPTFGAVISTGGVGLVDGSYVRLPFRAWYVKATDENMEHDPAVPDVIVENTPDSKAKGEDPQLKKSIEVLLQQIDKN